MALTPLDIHNREFGRSLRGYHPGEVDDFLDEIVREYDNALQENEILREEIQELRSRVEQYRQMEDTLQHTLVIAQETAEEVRENARKEAQVMIGEARAEMQRIRAEGDDHIDSMKRESERLRSQITEYLARAKANLITKMEIIEGAQKEMSSLAMDLPIFSGGRERDE